MAKKPNVKLPAIQKPSFTARNKNGLFSTGMICIAIAVVLVFNIAIGQLPTKYTQFDISTTQIYTMSDTTLDFLAKLDQDVDITVIASQEEADSRIVKFLDKYAALSDHLNLKWIDPVVYPSALTDYDCSADTIVVSCGEQTRNIPFTDILVMDEYYYYYYNQEYYTEFDGEGQLTSAIDYVISDTSHTVYLTENHGESSVGEGLSDLLTKNHFTVSQTSLMMDGIPEDCDVLLINCPTSDFSANEVEQLRSFLSKGGQLMLIWGSEEFDHPNLDSLMAEYGLEMAGGYVGDTTRFYQGAKSYFAFFPVLDSASAAAENTNADDLCLIYNSFGMNAITPARDTISVDTFLKTSESGIVSDGDDYQEGTYVVGATATEEVETDAVSETDGDAASVPTASFTVFSSQSMIDDSLNEQFGSSIVNLDVFMNVLTSGFDDVQNISIDAKSLEVSYNTVSNAGLWSLLYLAVLPAAFLIGGFVRWYKRRKL